MHLPTNGMIEQFNDRIEEKLQSHHFVSGENMETTLLRYVQLYNTQLPRNRAQVQIVIASDEGLTQAEVRTVQETAILPYGIWHRPDTRLGIKEAPCPPNSEPAACAALSRN